MLAVCVVSSLAALSVLAQATAQPPPRVLRIYREDVKHGMSGAHARVEAGWPKAFAKAGSANYYVGMTSLSGPNEAWFIEPHQSFAALEKSIADIDNNAALTADLDKLALGDSAFISGARNMIAVYNEELSRQSPDPFPLNRFVSVTTYRVRPGKAAEFTEFRKLLKSVNEKEKTSNLFRDLSGDFRRTERDLPVGARVEVVKGTGPGPESTDNGSASGIGQSEEAQ